MKGEPLKNQECIMAVVFPGVGMVVQKGIYPDPPIEIPPWEFDFIPSPNTSQNPKEGHIDGAPEA